MALGKSRKLKVERKKPKANSKIETKSFNTVPKS